MRTRLTVRVSGTAPTAWRYVTVACRPADGVSSQRDVYTLTVSAVRMQDWTFDDDGLMRKRQMSGNDVAISESDRWYKDGVDVNTIEIGPEHL